MLHEVQDVHEQLYAFNNTPIGTLRIGCSSTMAQNVLAGLTAKLLKEYPGLAVNLVTGIPAPDLIADGLDVVIRVGALQDSSLFSRRLGAMPMVVCAAKPYLAQYGVPENPPISVAIPGWNIACARIMSLNLSRRKEFLPD